jgi:hypothetical protein
MFEDLEAAAQEPVDDEEKSSWWLGPWAHFPAIVVFGVLFFLFKDHAWGWYVAIACSYTVYVFCRAFGSAFKDSDDLFGNSEVPHYLAKLLVPHALIVALIMLGVFLWFYLKPSLPSWLTHEGRKGSLWDLLGWLVLAGAGIKQGFWMADKLKRLCGQCDD